jgi:hypothetical protein
VNGGIRFFDDDLFLTAIFIFSAARGVSNLYSKIKSIHIFSRDHIRFACCIERWRRVIAKALGGLFARFGP